MMSRVIHLAAKDGIMSSAMCSYRVWFLNSLEQGDVLAAMYNGIAIDSRCVQIVK